MLSKDDISRMATRWFPSITEVNTVHYDTSEFFNVDYGDAIVLKNKAYLVRHNAKEGRFGLDDEVKFWVKNAVDLQTGARKIIKLEFYEKFEAQVSNLKYQCFRSPKKEARILDLVADHPRFMHGWWAKDQAGNIVRVLDYIYGKSLHTYIHDLNLEHEAYFTEAFPDILKNVTECVAAINFLHKHNEKHGDIRRDHILLDREAECYRWIDFDFNYQHQENMFGYDLFGLGNILIFITGKGDVVLQDLQYNNFPGLHRLSAQDMNVVFKNRVANLQKVFPYIPDKLNRILLHFSWGSHYFYESTDQLLEDLEDAIQTH